MKKSVVIFLMFALNACVSTNDLLTFKLNPTSDPRYSYARKLGQNEQLAEALVQWRILALVYPNSPEIKQQTTNLKKQIDQRVSSLEKKITQLGSAHYNEKQRQSLALKILALKPDYQPAIASLRRYNSMRELARVERKTEPVEKVTQKNPAKQDKDTNALNDLLARAEQQKAKGDFEQLLLSAQAIEKLAPQDPSLSHYRYAAWIGLADSKLHKNELDIALQLYEKAITFADDAQKKQLNNKIKQLRQGESERLYVEAMKVFTSDITQSIDLLKQAVSLNTTNQRAKQQLLRAETIRKNLNLIKKNQNTIE